MTLDANLALRFASSVGFSGRKEVICQAMVAWARGVSDGSRSIARVIACSSASLMVCPLKSSEWAVAVAPDMVIVALITLSPPISEASVSILPLLCPFQKLATVVVKSVIFLFLITLP